MAPPTLSASSRPKKRRAPRAAPVLPETKVTSLDLTFYRAVTDGIGLRIATDLYVKEGLDYREAKKKLRTIRATLRAAILRTGKPAEFARIELPAEILGSKIRSEVGEVELEDDAERAHPNESPPPAAAEASASAPSAALTKPFPKFEAWIEAEHIDVDSWGENELLAQYDAAQRAYEREQLAMNAAPAIASVPASATRNLPARIDEARALLDIPTDVRWQLFARLEKQLVSKPAGTDPPAAWLESRIAARLARYHIKTLAELAHAINARGERWYTHVKGLGPIRGARVGRFLKAHEHSIGVPIRVTALTARRAIPREELLRSRKPSMGIVPLEYLMLPQDLDGSAGANRAPLDQCRLDARNDRDAIEAFIRVRGANASTARAYRKEAERFLLWCVFERGRALSSINVDDCVEYRHFIANPTPALKWVSPRRFERWHPRWVPFAKPLDLRSQQYAIGVLKMLFEFLVGQRYLASSPWQAVPAVRAITGRAPTDRALTLEEWHVLLAGADRMGSEEGRRLRFVLVFAAGTGLRASELVNARIGDLRSIRLPDKKQGWLIETVGKRNKVRLVPFTKSIETALLDHLRDRGIVNALRNAPADVPLIGSLSKQEGKLGTPITAHGLYQSLKSRFARIVDSLGSSDATTARRLEAASTHWLRHTFATHGLRSGVPLADMRDLLGHDSIATSSLYISGDAAAMYEEVAKFVDSFAVSNSNDAQKPKRLERQASARTFFRDT